MKWLYILASVTFAFSASSIAAELTAEVPKGDPEFIAKAMSAAPADIGKDATFVRIGDGFEIRLVTAVTASRSSGEATAVTLRAEQSGMLTVEGKAGRRVIK